MFTGIVAAIGRISKRQPLEQGVRLSIDAGGLDLSDIKLGDSIAHNGVCLTVIKKRKAGYEVDVSLETLNCTTGLAATGHGQVNLEKALRLADRLGGHLGAGHVDGVGEGTKLVRLGGSCRSVRCDAQRSRTSGVVSIMITSPLSATSHPWRVPRNRSVIAPRPSWSWSISQQPAIALDRTA